VPRPFSKRAIVFREKFLTTRDVSNLLGLSEQEIIDLAKTGLIPHTKIGGEFLRFKRSNILKIRQDIKKQYNVPHRKVYHLERFKEFLYFNDFYIISTFIIIFLLWIIFKDYSVA